ncbi:MAG: Dipeptide transport system permease protein DppB in protein degradation cluster [Ilumatobacteraceae bacterium]|nr:Dipeptide transport system permease protein DppB in protein degradation cluster [Ilumatobacteraceae bacterium]
MSFAAATGRRLGQAAITLLVAAILIWSLLLITPGDPARRLLLANHIDHPTAAQLAAKRHQLGLDQSGLHRFAQWLSRAVRGDLGDSWASGRPVLDELRQRLPATLLLTGVAMSIAIVVAVVAGTVAGAFPRRWPDLLVRGGALVVLCVPSFLVGTILLDLVVVRWGHQQVVSDGSLATVALPAITLSLATTGAWTRILRASLLESRRAPHLEVAEARGASATRRMVRHALPNALVPFLTAVGVGVAACIGGAPIVETLFTWPGIGRAAVEAIGARDVPVIQGFTLFAVLAYVVVSTVVDLLAAAIDPRLRLPPRQRRTRRWSATAKHVAGTRPPSSTTR